MNRLALRILDMAVPHTRYLIGCNARSGSTWLCTLLRSLGPAAGTPHEIPGHYLRLSPPLPWADETQEKPRKVGRFHYDLMTRHHVGVWGAKLTSPAVLRGIVSLNDIGFTHCIWLDRDPIASAVSHFIANATGRFSETSLGTPQRQWSLRRFEELDFNFESIHSLVTQKAENRKTLQEFCEANNRSLSLSYENLCENTRDHVHSIVKFIGVDESHVDWSNFGSALQVQRTQKNTDFVEQYKAELANRNISSRQ